MVGQSGPGKSYRKGITLMDAVKKFDTEEKAETWFFEQRWPSGVACPFCGTLNVAVVASRKPQPFRCREKECRKSFSVKTGTLLHSSNLPLSKWAIAFFLYATNLKGVSSMKLHRDLGIAQSSAWYMAHRIREMWTADADKFAGPVEVDETYIGGKERNKHESKKIHAGRGAVRKAAVVGMKDRKTGRVTTAAVESTDASTLQGFVESRTEATAQVYTDEAAAYQGLARPHQAVKHSAREYVHGMAHTNGIESHWAMLKRGYVGVYHQMSVKLLPRYVAEFEGRHNSRPLDTHQADAHHGAGRGRQADDLRGTDCIMAAPNFADKTIWTGDNLDILRGMNSECVDLIYLDPPFNSNRNYAAPVGSKAAGAAFKDTWHLSDLDVAWMGLIADEQPAIANLLHTASLTHGKGMQSYLTMMAVRLMEMQRVLKDTGSIYSHCDDTASHYLKLLMDAVFGADNFRNMLVWHRTRGKGLNPTRYVRNCDHILFYGNGERPIWNQQYEPYEEGYGDNWRKDVLGAWEPENLSGGRAGGPEAYEPFNGVSPPSGRAWAPPTRTKFPPEAQAKLPDDYETLNQLQKCEALDVAGLIHWPKNGRPRYKKYLGYSPKTATCERMVAWDGRLGALDVNTPRAGAFGEVRVVVQPATTSGCPGRCRFGCRQGSGGDCCAGSSWGRVPR